MAPAGWATPEQKAFLEEELKEYIKVGDGKAFKKSWPGLFQRWRARWPEQATALPDVPLGQGLDEGQNRVLNEAVDSQIQQWLHWHSGVGDSRAANNKLTRLLNDLMQPKTHSAKLWEIYSKTHYKSHVKDSVPAGSNIVTIRQKIEDALKNEPPEVIDELKLAQAKQRATLHKGFLDDDSVEVDPLSIRKNIRELAPTLHRVLEHLAKKTSWSFSLIMGGPNPISPEEGNHIARSAFLHVGTDKREQDFFDAYSQYDTVLVEAYGEFLNSVVVCSGFGLLDG
ncbi:hypothetical protein EV363DRAFT_1158432 [Boletus edulis]|nr:hypothetical protein EV363DRAFT_1158432 [Boletus edulis]